MPKEIYKFGPYRIDVLARKLWRDAELLSLTDKQFVILTVLVRNAPVVVNYQEIIGSVWPDEPSVTEVNIRPHMNALRKTLGNDADGRSYIGTIRGQGYVIAVEVAALRDETCHEHESLPLEIQFPAGNRFRWERSGRKLALAVLLAAGGAAIAMLRTCTVAVPPPHAGRLLAGSTSEGRNPKRISLSHRADVMAISPKGDKLFSISGGGRVLSILHTADGSITTVALSREGVSLAVSPRGKLYIGSTVEGVMTLDIETERLIPSVIQTDGPVYDMAIDRAARSLFLAMGQLGLERVFLDSGKHVRISDRVCPIGLRADHSGRRLYVAYQCSGPAGREGHDSVGIFDMDSGASVGLVTGPPMVGTRPSISPDDKLVIFDGADACSNPAYDHMGCPFFPSRIFHLFDATNQRILTTLEYPMGPAGMSFFDSTRLIMAGNSVSIVDAAKYTVLEKFETAFLTGSAVVAPDASRFWVNLTASNALLEFRIENNSCSDTHPRPAMLFAGDGTFDDAVDLNTLVAHGPVRFTSGRVGQAFSLDGESYLSVSHTGYYQIGRQNFSVSLFVRLVPSSDEMTLIDWAAAQPDRGIRLTRSGDGHFVLDSSPHGTQLRSQTIAMPNSWYHLAVSKTDTQITLYVNGRAEASGKAPERFDKDIEGPLLLGADAIGHPSMQGSLDEVAFFRQALTSEDIGSLRNDRANSCRP